MAGHGWSLALQGTMNADPVVEISPYVDTLLQQVFAARTILRSTGEASLLTPKRPVEPFQMRGIDPSAGAQLANLSFDLLDGPGKRLATDFQQVPRVVANLLDNANPQARRTLQARMAFASMPATTPTVLDLTEDLKNGGAIRGVVVHHQQRILQKTKTANGDRRDQRHGRFHGARTHTQIDQKATFHLQSRMSPRATHCPMPRRPPFFSRPFSR